MMSMSFCHMHGPEHHIMVGAALLTAYKNAGGNIDLNKALLEMYSRGKDVPGGVCGFGVLVERQLVQECICQLLQMLHL